MHNGTSYYDILEINRDASDSDVKQAYVTLAKRHHPDQNPQNRPLAQNRFLAIREAYDALNTREKRAIYNQKIRVAAGNDNGYGLLSLVNTLLSKSKKNNAV